MTRQPAVYVSDHRCKNVRIIIKKRPICFLKVPSIQNVNRVWRLCFRLWSTWVEFSRRPGAIGQHDGDVIWRHNGVDQLRGAVGSGTIQPLVFGRPRLLVHRGVRVRNRVEHSQHCRADAPAHGVVSHQLHPHSACHQRSSADALLPAVRRLLPLSHRSPACPATRLPVPVGHIPPLQQQFHHLTISFRCALY